MSEEENAGVETNESQSTEETTEVKEEAGAPAAEEGEVDWKAVAAKEKERAENYKKAFTQKRQFVKAREEETDENEDAPITRKDLQQILTPALTENKVDTVLNELVKDPAKREAVRLIYDNRVRQTGTSDEAIRSDIDAALSIAEAPRLRKVSAELTRKTNMQTTPPLSGSSADRGADTKNHKFSADQVKSLTATAQRLGADPTKFIEQAWKNQGRG